MLCIPELYDSEKENYYGSGWIVIQEYRRLAHLVFFINSSCEFYFKIKELHNE